MTPESSKLIQDAQEKHGEAVSGAVEASTASRRASGARRGGDRRRLDGHPTYATLQRAQDSVESALADLERINNKSDRGVFCDGDAHTLALARGRLEEMASDFADIRANAEAECDLAESVQAARLAEGGE